MTNPDIKILYFDHRIRAEPSRLLLAYGNLDYKDERLPVPWDNNTAWMYIKPNMSWGQLPVLTWDGVQVGQSMTIARYIAREIGISGSNNLEMAQVDEIIDAIQDAITSMVKIASFQAEYEEHVYMYIVHVQYNLSFLVANSHSSNSCSLSLTHSVTQ